MPKDTFSLDDINNMRREALVKAGVIEVPTGYHMMPDGSLMLDSAMKQDLTDLQNATGAATQVRTDGSSNPNL